MTTTPDRTADDTTMSSDLIVWHHEDRPDCPNRTQWMLGPPGYACVLCDWWCSCA